MNTYTVHTYIHTYSTQKRDYSLGFFISRADIRPLASADTDGMDGNEYLIDIKANIHYSLV